MFKRLLATAAQAFASNVVTGLNMEATGQSQRMPYFRKPGPGAIRAHKRLMARRAKNREEEKARIADDVRRRPPSRQVRRRAHIEVAKERRTEAKARAADSIKRAKAQRMPSLAIQGGPAAMRLPKTVAAGISA